MKIKFNAKTIIVIILAVILIALPIDNNRRNLNIAILTLMYIALGQSWNILRGMAGLFSIAHAIFFGIGVYAISIGLQRFNLPVVVALIMGVCVNLVVGLIVGLIGSHLSGLYFTMALVAIQSVLYKVSGQLQDLTGGWLGISMPREYLLSRRTLYFIALLLSALATLAYFLIRRSRLGTNFVALKENPDLANALGSNIYKYRLISVLISACMASVVGSFYAFYIMSNNPEVFSGGISIKIIMVAVVGGIGSAWGPILGGSMIIFDEIIRGAMPSNFASFSVIIYSLILILFVMLKPEGIAKSKWFLADSIFSRKDSNKNEGA